MRCTQMQGKKAKPVSKPNLPSALLFRRRRQHVLCVPYRTCLIYAANQMYHRAVLFTIHRTIRPSFQGMRCEELSISCSDRNERSIGRSGENSKMCIALDF